jgi:hypothetical protein
MARRKKKFDFIDYHLLKMKVPDAIITSEKVHERILGKKIKPSKKIGVKWKAATKNYGTAITRYKRSLTLLEKHYKILAKIVKKHNL